MQFDLEFLFMPALVIFFATGGVTFKVTRSAVFSIFAAIMKSGVFLLYFRVLFDGTFTFSDDWDYLERGYQLYIYNIGISNLMENLDYIKGLTEGEHFFYALQNSYAFRLFGVGYYAPVALNILLTILIAWFGANLADIEFSFNGVWKKLFFAFLLFHPDIFAWSNVFNGKDILVLLLHVILLFSVSLYFRGQLFTSLGLAFFVCWILSSIRFYVPVLFASAFALSLLLMQKNHNRLLQLFVGFITLIIAVGVFKDSNLQENVTSFRANFINPFYGFIRFILTPIPFGTGIAYSFLDVPALIHWILIPVAMTGFVTILKRSSNFGRFFIIYLLIFTILYSCYGELQGSRHRVQLDFAWAVLQFTGIKLLFMPALRFRSSPRHIKTKLYE